MSYNYNVYAGWYVTFAKSNRKKLIGTKSIRQCPTSKKHDAKGAFCPRCGKAIETVEQEDYQNYGWAFEFLNISSEQEIREETLGLCGLADVRAVGEAYVVFPEFLPTDDIILFAPGYITLRDISRNNPKILNLNPENTVTPQWIEAVKKLFDTENIQTHFGMVTEVI